MTWSPSNYLRFEDERTRAARELLARVPLSRADCVVDVGCGPGNSTELLAERFPDAQVIGLDTSAEMLEAARKRMPHATFVDADITEWSPGRSVELIFANAVFQWVPDHLTVLARLLESLSPGAVLALQVPDNFGEPSLRLMSEIARNGARNLKGPRGHEIRFRRHWTTTIASSPSRSVSISGTHTTITRSTDRKPLLISSARPVLGLFWRRSMTKNVPSISVRIFGGLARHIRRWSTDASFCAFLGFSSLRLEVRTLAIRTFSFRVP